MRLALAAVAALAVAAAGCGGAESEPNLAQAAERTGDEPSFAFEADVRRTVGGESGFECAGVVDNTARRLRISCPYPDGPSEQITIGDVTYAKSPGDEKWMKLEVPGSDEPALSPVLMLGLLRDASREIARVGEEDVRGEPTVHYELTVDCQEAEIKCDGETVVDVWIAEDGLVRRVAVDEVGTSVTMEFFDFGVPGDVDPPPPEQVEKSFRPDPVSCTTQRAGPITALDAIDALRRHGFEVDPLAFACSEGVAGFVGTQTGKTADAVRGAGYATCVVFAEGASGNAPILPPLEDMDPLPPVRRAIENLECWLFADGPRADDRVAAFEAALDELKR
jgi:hypothetical protein